MGINLNINNQNANNPPITEINLDDNIRLENLNDTQLDQLARLIHKSYAKDLSSLSVEQIKDSLVSAQKNDESIEQFSTNLVNALANNPKLPPPANAQQASPVAPVNNFLAPNILVLLTEIWMKIVATEIQLKAVEHQVKINGLELQLSLTQDLANTIKALGQQELLQHAIQAGIALGGAAIGAIQLGLTVRARRSASEEYDNETEELTKQRSDNQRSIEELQNEQDPAVSTESDSNTAVSFGKGTSRNLSKDEQTRVKDLQKQNKTIDDELNKRKALKFYREEKIELKTKDKLQTIDRLVVISQGLQGSADQATQAAFAATKANLEAQKTIIQQGLLEINRRYLDGGYEGFKGGTDAITDALRQLDKFAEIRTQINRHSRS